MAEGMDTRRAARTLQAVATFQPDATTKDLPAVIADLRRALDELAEILTD
jgi:hypothetical protein